MLTQNRWKSLYFSLQSSDFYCEFAADYKQNFIKVIMRQKHKSPLLTAFKHDQVFPSPLPRKIKLHGVSSQNTNSKQEDKNEQSCSLLIHCTHFKQHWNFISPVGNVWELHWSTCFIRTKHNASQQRIIYFYTYTFSLDPTDSIIIRMPAFPTQHPFHPLIK